MLAASRCVERSRRLRLHDIVSTTGTACIGCPCFRLFVGRKEITVLEYDELVARHNAAHAAHVEMYKAKRPQPSAPELERTDWVVMAALSIMVVSSVIVSGSRTITEFGGGVVGVAAFAMLELGIVGAAYVYTRRNYDEKRHASVKRLTRAGMWLAFVVAVAANVHATLKGGGVQFGDTVNLIILVSVAISAPALALISGELLAMEAVTNAARTRKSKAVYDAALADWWTDCNRAFDAQKARLGVRVEVLSERPKLSVQMDSLDGQSGQSLHSGAGYVRVSSAKQMVLDYLSTNPSAADMGVRELAQTVGVGKSTAASALKEYRERELK